MTKTVYYDLYSLSKTPGYPEKRWYEEGQRTWLCPGCCHPRSTSGSIDAYLAYPPDNAAINFISGVGIGYAQLALLEAIKVAATCLPFSLGRIYNADGQPLENYATFRADELLFIRGKQVEGEYGSKFRICPVCRRSLYHPMGSRYIVKSELTGVPVYESSSHSLVLDDITYQSIKQYKWKKLGVWKLPVVDMLPLDRPLSLGVQ